jgi:hypothetical protein
MSTALLSWAGKSFASGIVGAAGGMAFNAFLESVGVPNPSKQALEKLNQILAHLDAVAGVVDQINKRVADLAVQLDIAKLDIQKGAQENVVKAAIANIQTHTSGSRRVLQAVPAGDMLEAAVISPIASLTDWGRRLVAREPVPAEAVEEFTRNVITTWDIPRAVNEIGNGLLGVSNDDGTLRAWTALYVAQMKGRMFNPRLLSFYESLEQRFLFAVGVQIQAAYLVMIAKSYGTPGGGVPESARQWLARDFVASTLQPQVDLFLSCVEGMALSQSEWRSPTPGRRELWRKDADGNPVALAGLAVHPDAGKILMRSELVGRRLVEAFRDMRDYPDPLHQNLAQSSEVDRTSGIYVHRVCREGDLVAGAGPQLTPWPTGGQNGHVLPASGVVFPTWKGNTSGYASLEKPESSSRLRVVRYFWRWFDIRGSFQPFVNGKAVRDILLKPADFTAMGIDWPNFESGHALDVSGLYVQQLTANAAGAWTVSGVSGASRVIGGEVKTEGMSTSVLTDDDSRGFYLAMASLRGRQLLSGGMTEQREVSAVMSCPLFTYTGSEPRTLRLHLWLSMSASRNFTNCPRFYMRGAARVTLKGPSSDTLLYDSDVYNKGKLNLWEKEITGGNFPPQATDEPVFNQAITLAGTGAAEQYRLQIELRVGYQGVCPGATADIMAVVKELSVSWQ